MTLFSHNAITKWLETQVADPIRNSWSTEPKVQPDGDDDTTDCQTSISQS
jgi:hypothetical protein